MAHPLLTRLLVGISGAAIAAGCGGSDDTANQGETSPGTAGAAGASAGSAGASAGAAGASAGTGGSAAGAGGALMGGAGGALMGGTGGTSAGAGGAKAGAGGATAGGGGMKGGAAGASAGAGGASAGAGGATPSGCKQDGDCVLDAWCSTSSAPESYCHCVGAGAYACGAPPMAFSNVTVCIAPDSTGCPALGDATLNTRINAEYVSMSCGAFPQTPPESKTTTAGVAKCCYGVITDACVGRPLFVGEQLAVATLTSRDDWA